MNKLEFLYQDQDIYVLNKPSGIHSVNLKESKNSIASLLLDKFPQLSAINEEAGLVQRLDFETSGCLLGAFNINAFNILKKQIKAGGLVKQYQVLIEHEIKPQIIRMKIGSSSRNSKKVKTFLPNKNPKRALPAESRVIEVKEINKRLFLATVQAKTGRRHQIRAHLASIGVPLIGDVLYGSTTKLEDHTEFKGLLNLPLFILHASNLEFTHPVTLKKMRVLSELKLKGFN